MGRSSNAVPVWVPPGHRPTTFSLSGVPAIGVTVALAVAPSADVPHGGLLSFWRICTGGRGAQGGWLGSTPRVAIPTPWARPGCPQPGGRSTAWAPWLAPTGMRHGLAASATGIPSVSTRARSWPARSRSRGCRRGRPGQCRSRAGARPRTPHRPLEREALEARLALNSPPGAGTRIRGWVPCGDRRPQPRCRGAERAEVEGAPAVG